MVDARSILLVAGEADAVGMRQSLPVGWTVVSMATTAEAAERLRLDEAKSALPALVVLDYDLPDSSALLFLMYVKAKGSWRHLPVVLWTGVPDAQRMHEVGYFGAAAFLMRPRDPESFASAARRLVAIADQPPEH
ncbi:MAG: response regulator transcription factor [Planctomycetes bacterium]|nr:response regulator transcription factor [Planctomycetota bacterium]